MIANNDDRCGYLGKVVSKGNNSGNDFFVFVNGSRWNLNTGRGWSFVTFDRYTGAQKSSNHFDPYGDSNNVGRMINYINTQIDDNDIVCFGIQDEGSKNMSNQAWNALKTLGYSGISIGYRESYAAIGRKNGGLIKEKKEKKGSFGRSNGKAAEVSGCIVSCQYRCNTCSDAPLKCKQCKIHSTRQNNPPNCDCKHGYIDDGQHLACLQCSHKCNGCRDNVNKCNACSHGTRQNAPTCGCKSNYYEDGSAECKQCDSKCQECSTRTTCTSCKSGLFRQGTPQCNCQAGYYDNGQPQCQKCQHPCVNCSNQNTCTSCVARPNANSFPSCTCKDGYYESSSRQCLKCIDKCKLCSNSSQCQQCIDGYYKNQSNQCVKCPEKCSKCSDQNTCTECKAGNQRSGDLSKNCSCNDGWFESTGGDLDCVKCPSLCKTCTFQPTCLTCIDEYFKDSSNQCQSCHKKCSNCTSQNSCTGCKAGIGRSVNLAKNCICNDGWYEDAIGSLDCVQCQVNCSICTLGSECQTCNDEFFKDSNNQCQKCSDKCSKCSLNKNQCNECKVGNQRSGDLSKNCKCNDGWYEDAMGSLDCHKCQTNCAVCDTGSQCEQCIDGYYKDAGNQCQKCPEKCSKCSDQNTCIECKIGQGRNNDLSSNCGCQDGWFENSQKNLDCKQCQHPCVKCSSQYHCLSCLDEPLREKNHPCNCLPMSFENVDKKCVNCNLKCKSCKTYDYCLSCNEPNRIFPDCNCIQGYYEDQQQNCQKCDSGCLSCKQRSDKCTVCVIGVGRKQSPSNCACQDGYFSVEGKNNCKRCPPECSKCTSYQQCTECSNKEFLLPLCNQQKQGNFSLINQEQKKILQCDKKCLNCTQSSDQCIQCKQGLNRSNQIPGCNCIHGYHDQNGEREDCIKCPKICESCISSSECSTCSQNKFLILNAYTKKCECEKGMIYDKISQICKKCFQYKGNCLTQCPHSTKQDFSNNICLEQNTLLEQNLLLVLPIGCFLGVSISFIIYKILSRKIWYMFNDKIQILRNIKDEPSIIEQNQKEKENNNHDDSMSISVQNENIITL